MVMVIPDAQMPNVGLFERCQDVEMEVAEGEMSEGTGETREGEKCKMDERPTSKLWMATMLLLFSSFPYRFICFVRHGYLCLQTMQHSSTKSDVKGCCPDKYPSSVK